MLKGILQKFTSEWVNATNEVFKEHPVAKLFRHDFKKEVESVVRNIEPKYLVKASVGNGNWANVAWLSILDPSITKTTQSGVYPVYLVKADGTGVYLSLNQGVTALTKSLGKSKADIQIRNVKERLLAHIPGLENWGELDIDLNAETTLGKSYESPNIAAKFYAADSIPEDYVLQKDLEEMLSFYKKVGEIETVSHFEETQIIYPDSNPSLQVSKPFLLLAGISGTGKTRFVREQVSQDGMSQAADNYCLEPVRPDWHEPSDLLGYSTRLSGKAEYVATNVLRFLVKAWREIYASGIDLQGCKATGHKSHLSDVRPFWLCLDEMNLAPVEQYFADYLSIIETREWCWDGDDFTYESQPLLTSGVINDLNILNNDGSIDDDSAVRNLAASLRLNLNDENDAALWQHFCIQGIGLPFNLIVAGTVNMDETTHGFSRKVIDRALTFDFDAFFPNDFDAFFAPQYTAKRLSYPIYSSAKDCQTYLPAIDREGLLSIAFLKAVNGVLDGTPFKLAYRALNELLLSVVCQQPENDIALQAVWDDFLMCKVLPRIEGDVDKLTVSSTNGDVSLLDELEVCTKQQLHAIWGNSSRPDFYRQSLDEQETPEDCTCRSKEAIARMQGKLSMGFTSFWP